MSNETGCNRKTVYRVAALAALITLLVYLRALTCGFVNWEDQDYVVNNTAIRSLDRDFFIWAFTTMPLAFWLPLTWLSFALDYHFWGLDPFGYHLTNILLHGCNAGLVVLLADRLLKLGESQESRAAGAFRYPALLLLAGLLWAVHPARVESVAWVTERKDVLNGLFTIGALLFYLRYLQAKTAGCQKNLQLRAYGMALLLFACSLMAKPTSVVLPLLLLVLDWYPLGRLKKGMFLSLLAEKVPFLLLSAGLTLLTVYAGTQQNALNPLSEFPLGLRLIASGNSIFEYFKLMLFPFGILPYYDLPRAIPQIYIVKAVIVALLFCSALWWGRKLPWLAAMLLLFVIPLLPILHLSANGQQLILAPRYTYLAALLPGILLVGTAAPKYQLLVVSWSKSREAALAAIVVALLLFYAGMTWRVTGFWHDSGAMWSRVIAHQPFDRAYFYRGLYYVDSGNYRAAVDDYTVTLATAEKERNPEIYNLYAFRGEALLKAGLYEQAIDDFSAALALFPHRLYFYQRATALLHLGRSAEAAKDFERAGKAQGQVYWFPLGSPLY